MAEINQEAVEEFLRFERETMSVCPVCGHEMPHDSYVCHFAYGVYKCKNLACGVEIDSRVGGPKLVRRCLNEWPDYQPFFSEPVHPLACSCTGRGWYEFKEGE